MAWTALTYAFGSLLTSTKMTQLFDNLTALANGDSGAPAIVKKVGTFTRDTAIASGNQAITGIGFQPSAIIFFANIAGSTKASWGIDDGTTPRNAYDDTPTASDTYNSAGGSILLQFGSGGSANYTGEVTSLDADGFTVAWTKLGGPTGTATINYLALR